MSYTTPTGAGRTPEQRPSTSRRNRRTNPSDPRGAEREVGASPRPDLPLPTSPDSTECPIRRSARRRRFMAHLVTAIIKPFKLEEVKEALRGAGILGLTVERDPGLRPPRRQDRSLPRQRVQDRVRPEGHDRSARRHQRRRQGDRHHRPAAPAPERSVTARSGRRRSTGSCASVPASSATMPSEELRTEANLTT